MIRKLNPTLRDLIAGIIACNMIQMLVGLLFSSNRLSFALGTLAGGTVAVGIAIHMYCTLDKGLDMQPDAAKKYITMQSILRLCVIFLVGAVAMWVPDLHFLAVIFGVLSLKVSALMQPVIHKCITRIVGEGR